MRGFAFNRSDMTREGYQRHHLIPVEVVCQPALASIMNPLITTGFNPREFNTNGVWLPASEQVAIKTGLPLHRGPHPHYNAFVSDQVAFLSRGLAIPSRDGLVALKLRLNNLQGNLWRALSRADTSMWLSRRDPREDLAEFATFDDDLRQLSMADLLV
jgi:A nuclease family of the HNH/ENDO VII superfamily with conserved AHH